jgi:hypothetical protein
MSDKNCKNEGDKLSKPREGGGEIELRGTDFFMFLSFLETPRRSCSRKLLRCTIISVYRYIAAVRQARFL